MFRRFRHKLLMLLQLGILVSGGITIALQPTSWRAVLLCTLGSTLTALVIGRITRRYLHATLGGLRRIADDIGRGRTAVTIDVQPGDDMYKLTSAVNLLATRLAEASRQEVRLHEELRRRERLAFLGELAASVAHEINNPLDGVQNCARILRRALEDPERAGQMLDLIDNGLGRIEMIVRRLLTLAREHVIRPKEARLTDVLAGAVEIIRPRVDGRSIEIRQRPATENDTALVDQPLLEQVFVNLMLNAADSMPEGGTLTVTIQRETTGRPGNLCPAEDVLCVEVADTGIGIPPEVLPHIFEPFFTTKPGGKGTGLGLAIAARIIDAHHGAITVAAGPTGGAVFTVRIPAATQPAPTPRPLTALTPSA